MFEQPRRAKNGEVVRFGSSAGNNDFTRLRAEEFRRAVAGVVEQRPGLSADMMDAGGIAPNVAEKRQHRLAHRRIQRRRGVVIEVNRPRHWRIFQKPRAADEEKEKRQTV